MLRGAFMTFLLVLSIMLELALETEVPNLLPADSLSALLSAGCKSNPGGWVMRVAQDVTQKTAMISGELSASSDPTLSEREYQRSIQLTRLFPMLVEQR